MSYPRTGGTPPNDGIQDIFMTLLKPDKIMIFLGSGQVFRLLNTFDTFARPAISITNRGKNRHSWQVVSKSGAPVYRAPEIRRSDKPGHPARVWSLGCIFLDILVWHVDGYEELNAFRDRREVLVVPNGRGDDGFYYFAEAGREAQAQIRETVTEKFQDLLNRTTGPFRSAVQIVKAMLEIDPGARPTAEAVERELGQRSAHFDNESISRPISRDGTSSLALKGHNLSDSKSCAEQAFYDQAGEDATPSKRIRNVSEEHDSLSDVGHDAIIEKDVRSPSPTDKLQRRSSLPVGMKKGSRM